MQDGVALNRKKRGGKLFFSEQDRDIIHEKIKKELGDKILHECIIEKEEKYLNILMNILKKDKDLKINASDINKGTEIYYKLSEKLV